MLERARHQVVMSAFVPYFQCQVIVLGIIIDPVIQSIRNTMGI